MNVWWIRRDARLDDNPALVEAASSGWPLVLLHCWDPRRTSNCLHASHVKFITEGLTELEAGLKRLYRADQCPQLTHRVGPTELVLGELFEQTAIGSLHSSEVIGDAADQEIDAAVACWCAENDVVWEQHDQFGIEPSSISKEALLDWAGRAALRPPESIEFVQAVPAGKPVGARELSLRPGARPEAQIGGELKAEQLLQTWLSVRGRRYSKELSSPSAAWTSNSRLSAYIAWGHLSFRRIFQAVVHKQQCLLKEAGTVKQREEWSRSLVELQRRMGFRLMFMRRLRGDASMMFDLHIPAFEGMRYEAPLEEKQQSHLRAWIDGKTGYPLVDACMRCLQKSGWVNMRMRAMILSFAVYDLWLDWRVLAEPLAALFLDYDPGIHYPQLESGSGTDGIEFRMYNPTKQCQDHDPEGTFIRMYVPELSTCPFEFLFEPWCMPAQAQARSGIIIGEDYPAPIVKHTEAMQVARGRLVSVDCRASLEFRRNGVQILPPAAMARGKSSLPTRTDAISKPGSPPSESAAQSTISSKRWSKTTDCKAELGAEEVVDVPVKCAVSRRRWGRQVDEEAHGG